MNKQLKQLLKKCLREASNMGERGFAFDYDEGEQNEEWEYFENSTLEDIDNFLSNFGQGDF